MSKEDNSVAVKLILTFEQEVDGEELELLVYVNANVIGKFGRAGWRTHSARNGLPFVVPKPLTDAVKKEWCDRHAQLEAAKARSNRVLSAEVALNKTRIVPSERGDSYVNLDDARSFDQLLGRVDYIICNDAAAGRKDAFFMLNQEEAKFSYPLRELLKDRGYWVCVNGSGTQIAISWEKP